MKVAIIGAGFTGLSCAYRLSKKGHKVTIFEKGPTAGGLAAGFKEKNWSWSLEFFYHHLFPSDLAIQRLIRELNLDSKLFFKRPKTSVFYHGKISQFDSPFSLLSFPFLSLLDKLRTGLATLYLQKTNNWMPLEKVTAFDWLKKAYGQKAFSILWQPLIASKFGPYADSVAMSWFWARIKKRNPNLGYIEGGFKILVQALVEKIKENNGEIILNHSVESLDNIKGYDRIIVTLPSSAFLKIAPSLPADYKKKLEKLTMLGAIVLIFRLKEKFLTDDTYWLNINEPGFPFVAVVEHTNFIDPKNYGGERLLYVGGYYPQDHQFFTKTDKELLNIFLPFLQKINPNFDFKSKISNYKLLKGPFAQPVMPINFSFIKPDYHTPLTHVYLANIQQIYPWDRQTNYSIEEGEKIALLVLSES
ncbi:MAG: NAD(P)/FAD-dependent oxidoreductase [bacterium]|nr:NAD(P)/FAD-dependent oxidoreductase [bacterium]